MDIREKLNLLSNTAGINEHSRIQSTPFKVSNFLPGEVCENSFGTFHKSVSEIPLDLSHGNVRLDSFKTLSNRILNLMGGGISIISDFNIKDVIFLDTETTGLAGGAGTVPFLTGLGYFSDSSFKVVQLLMRDFSEEQAVLYEIGEVIGDRSAIITYNGKCYDLNVLASRFTISKMENPLKSMNHLDLLFTVRRVWRKRIGSCSLANVEEKILNFNRGEDIPGFLIPGVYFDFIRTGNHKELLKVLKHNVLDILSLTAATSLLGQIYSDPVSGLVYWQDILSMGRIYNNVGDHEKAAECFKRSAKSADRIEDVIEALIHLGMVYKRTGRWKEAEKIWLYIIEKSPKYIEIYEELAKYYEHHKKDIPKATDIVLRALENTDLQRELYPHISHDSQRQRLIYRLSRLRRKEKFSE